MTKGRWLIQLTSVVDWYTAARAASISPVNISIIWLKEKKNVTQNQPIAPHDKTLTHLTEYIEGLILISRCEYLRKGYKFNVSKKQ